MDTTTRLTLGELWAIPIALRITLLTRLCDAAELCLKEVDHNTDVVEINDDATMIAGCIMSLRTVATSNWLDFVEQTNAVEPLFRRDPSEFYQRMDFVTRDCYRAVVEKISRRTKSEQWEVAQAALQLAEDARLKGDSAHRQHIGYYLIDNGRSQLESVARCRLSIAEQLRRRLRKYSEGLYLFAIVSLAIIGSAALLLGLTANGVDLTTSVAAAVIALIPVLSVSSGLVNFALSLLIPPKLLPKLDFAPGIPADQQSIVVVPMLLSSTEDIAEDLATLEQNYLGNSDSQLRFALLSDFVDAKSAEMPDDQRLLDQAIAGIDHLNNRYAVNGAGSFYLFHRRRLWNDVAQQWMGWERKRGKLEEFNELLRGADDTSFVLQHGYKPAAIRHTRYVITLDADSYMPTGTAARLVGAMAHPLNCARFDESSDRVVGGYTVIQPRLETNPVTGADTYFARIFAGDVMLDLYTNAVSNVYQDLFGDAVFAGKGIYDVDAFRRSVARKVPPNTVLSHDLLEGLLGRAGLASDIVLLENYPSNYLIYLKRLHRWVRGDWQLMPWLTKRDHSNTRAFNPGMIGRWKLIDNLRRSLVTPAILALLVVGWIWLPSSAIAWTLLFALFPGLPILLRLTLALRTSLWRWGTIESSLRNLIGHAGSDVARWLLALVFLPAEAYVVTDAVLRTIYRVAVSRHRLLEWSAAAQVSRDIRKASKIASYWRDMWFGPSAAVATWLGILLFNPHALIAASTLLVLWPCSPLIALYLGRHIVEQPPVRLDESDTQLIHLIARDTWRFFERFVGASTHWLPPDNVQEYPNRTIAERTSPTNIGMMLLATVTAYDLGYIGHRQLISRLTNHLESIQRMRRHCGHLFNWYSTRDLQPLQPLYVSTVDSGNFVAALIVACQTLEQLPHHRHTGKRTIAGLSDELAAMRHQLIGDKSSHTDAATQALANSLDAARVTLSKSDDLLAAVHLLEHQYCGEIEQAFLQALEKSPSRWSAEEIANFRENNQVFRQRIRIILEDIDIFAPWTKRLLAPPAVLLRPETQHRLERLTSSLSLMKNSSDFDVRLNVSTQLISELLDSTALSPRDDPDGDTRAWLEALQLDIENSRSQMQALKHSGQVLMRNIETLIDDTDFGFLYDTNRHLFHVGYNASTGEADASYYDLLASEARIASLIAIAEGQIPAKHWMHLGRPLTRIRGLRVLLSWSATAFEYLMPRLIMRSPSTGLLNQSCAGVVKEQIRFGHKHSTPWGVSESGYAQFDAQGHYQYYAFGIPKLGLKWDQGERLVISSYSSILALPYAGTKAVHNLRHLIRLGASGHFGLFEALDFGEVSKPRPVRPRVVQSYMAHHQGMILVAIGNALHNDKMLRRFHRDPRIASVEHLLYERLPQRIQTRHLERLPSPLKKLPNAPATATQWQVETDRPELAVLSNGHLSSRVTDQGGGALYWRGMAITRWDPLHTGPAGGTCIYLKYLQDDRLQCLGGEPLQAGAEVFFAPHNAEFRTRQKDILMRMSVTVAPSDDVEIRKITITNDGLGTRHVMLASYSEPVLGQENADKRHPSFSKLFVESRLLKDESILLFRRRPREPDQPPVYFAHTSVTQAGCEVSRQIEFDRRAFFGRRGYPTGPAAMTDPAYQPSDTAISNLDPCAAILLTLEIRPRSTVHCAFLSSVGDSRGAAVDALQPFRSLQRIDWSVEAARLQSERELTDLRMNSERVRASFKLLAGILWPRSMPHIGANSFDDVHQVQDSLWRHSVSGDRPIITIRIDGEEDLYPAEAILKSVDYLSRKGFAIDVIFLDETTGGYVFPINDRLRKLVDTHLVRGRDRDGSSAFIVPARTLSAREKSDLIVAARVFVDSDTRKSSAGPDVTGQFRLRMPGFVPQPSAPLSGQPVAPLAARRDLQFGTSLGGMLPDLSGYSLLISSDSRTPAPWCNVLANPEFGTLVSESGSMCTWWGNSSERRLTPWNNDPVLDQTGEAIYVRDEETGESWSLTPQPRPDDAPYRVTHAVGESLFEHNSHGLEQRLQVFVDAENPVKILRIRLANKWHRTRRLTVTFAVEWLLGNSRTYDSHLRLPERDGGTGALFVRNGFDRNASDELAFVASDLPSHGVTCDGDEFFGSRHSWAAPSALAAIGLSDHVGPNAQPCAIYQVHIDLQFNEAREFHFTLGAAKNRQAATDLINESRKPEWVDQSHAALQRQWDSLLGAWQVKTPDIATDAMVNRWLLYQVISSRLWGRIGFYQASGGFGFRDQLQDVLALLDSNPEAAREQILIAASRQFEEGDVLHWWHESPLRGVRTRCSDDLLWLAYAVAEYIDVTDNVAILHDTAPFLQGEPLGQHELERYAEYQASPGFASVYEHCHRAIDERLTFGAHGMPFIGTGDWNDGLNRVGVDGHGESVWMAWFLVVVCRRFAPLCRQMDDDGRADHYNNVAADLLRRTQESAWTGHWYLRGYYDDGTPLGAPGDDESEIDLNAQTWAVFADPDDPAARQAMLAVDEKLVDAEHRLIRLLTPPFEKTTHDPGYIRSYPPGVRENGGQYTHAAVWAAWAAVESGDKEKAMRWFDWLNPLKRVRSDEEIEQYRLEPYVTAGDIYSVGAMAGRGGWSWYTGSAAWLYQLAIRKLLGLQRRGDRLFVRPCLPSSWPSFQATMRYKTAVYQMQIHNPCDIQRDELFLIKDGSLIDAQSIELEESGRHVLEIFAGDAARRYWLAQHPPQPQRFESEVP